MSPTRLWHPFANMAEVVDREVLIDHGRGVWLWDADGRRFLDATAGLWFCAVGHGREELADAAAQQMRRLAAYSTFGRFANQPALTLAERLAAIAPIDDAAVFLVSGGSEAIDTAAKLVRRYWHVVGQPSREFMIVREGSYHGMNAYGTSLAGIDANRAGYGELVAAVLKIPADDTGALERLLDQHRGRVAAVFVEPVRGACGVRWSTHQYWLDVIRLCRAHDVLLVVDEVVTAFGRLGEWFASSRFGIKPDLIVGAKSVTSGYAPLGFVVCGPRIQEPFWKGHAGIFRHGFSYCGHAAASAVALANLDVLDRERLVDHSRESEPAFAAALSRLSNHPLVEEVRSIGFMAGVQLVPSMIANDPGLADRVVDEARRQGVLIRALVGGALQVSPPLVIDQNEINSLVTQLNDALEAVAGRPTSLPVSGQRS